MTIINSTILPFVHAEGDNLNESFAQIEREVDAEFQLKQERAAHEKTRAALAAQTAASQHIANERQIERILQAHPNLTQKALANVTALLLKGDAGELESDKNGKLREKFGTRSLDELTADYLRENPHFIGDGSAESASAASKLDRAKMSTKQKADYISEHGQGKYLALPHGKDSRKK
jgi:hypothetical protein